jgi:hypothetical protein
VGGVTSDLCKKNPVNFCNRKLCFVHYRSVAV